MSHRDYFPAPGSNPDKIDDQFGKSELRSHGDEDGAEIPESELIERPQATATSLHHDVERIWEFYERLCRYVARILELTETDPEVGGIVSQVLLDFVLMPPENRKEIKNERAWLFTISRNKACTRKSKQNRVTQTCEFDHLSCSRDDGGNTPEDDAMDAELWPKVEMVLSLLPPRQRDVFSLNLMFGDDFTSDQMGAMLGMTGSAFRVALSDARPRFWQEWLLLYGPDELG